MVMGFGWGNVVWSSGCVMGCGWDETETQTHFFLEFWISSRVKLANLEILK